MKWFGTFTSIIGAFLVAAKMPELGYIFFIVGSASWLYVGVKTKDSALSTLNLVFFLANVLGVYNYVI